MLKKIKRVSIISSLFFATFFSLNASSADYYEETVNRSYTSTVFHYPFLCKNEEFFKQCQFFTNYYVSRFEHNYIGYITDHLDLENNENDQLVTRDLAYQDVVFDMRVIKPANFISIIAIVNQEYLHEKSSFTEVFNFNLKTQKLVHFEDLFEDPELGAMICSDLFYDKFKKYKSKNLDLVKAQLEVEPRNFLLLPDGIEFIISKGVVAPSNVKSRLFVSTEDLIFAKPKKQWFPLLSSSKNIKKRSFSKRVDPLEKYNK